MQGGVVRDDQRDLTATSTDAYSASVAESADALDNMIAGGIAASSFSHDDIIVGAALLNVSMLAVLLVFEVSQRW